MTLPSRSPPSFSDFCREDVGTLDQVMGDVVYLISVIMLVARPAGCEDLIANSFTVQRRSIHSVGCSVQPWCQGGIR
jgi:hypothetical protein